MTDDLEPPVLTGEQRDLIRSYFAEHPDGGYKAACKHAGILRLTKTEARALIEADPDLAETRERALGVDEDSAWKRVADIARDTGHKDMLRANTFILAAIHGRHEQPNRLEVTGPEGGPVKVNTQHGVSLTDVAALLVKVGALPGFGSNDDRPALPAAPPVLAEPLPES